MADEMLRIGGRSDDGLAKALRTDEDGNAEINLNQSRTEIETYDINNKLKGRSNTNSHWQPRTTGRLYYDFPHSSIGVFEQAFAIRNTLDVDVEFIIMHYFDFGDGLVEGPAILNTTIPADGRFLFASDKGNHHVDDSAGLKKAFEVTDLRLPIDNITIRITPLSTPASGDIKIQNIRRY